MTEAWERAEDMDDAFSRVANDTRFEIIQSLWSAAADGEGPLAFSTLRERTGIEDSGQFNYHLGELVPQFVRDSDDGYALTWAGRKVIGAAVSGVYTDATSTAVGPLGVGTCPNCSGTLEGTYANGEMVIECADCGVTVTDGLSAPPIVAAGHDHEELPTVLNKLLLTEVQKMARGFCNICSGEVEITIQPPENAQGEVQEGTDDEFRELFGVRSTCQECGFISHGVVGAYLLDHPAVTALLWDAGIDIRKTPVWELEWLFEPHTVLLGQDPLRAEVTIAVADDSLTLTVDEDLTVLDHERATSETAE